MNKAMSSRLRRIALWVTALTSTALAANAAPRPTQVTRPQVVPAALEEAVQMVFSDFRVEARYEYVMTGKIRLLILWIGRDDVGDGLITLERGRTRPELDAIRLKIGSDPEKAPRGINRWGAAAEVVEHDVQRGTVASTAFFGFMKATEGDTFDAVEAELESEGGGSRHLFEASINRIEPSVALSSVLPIESTVDFDIGQLPQAERMVREQYERAFSRSNYRRLNGNDRGACARSASFLFTLKEVIDAAVEGRANDGSRCFVYNSKLYTLTIERQRPVARQRIEYELVDGTEVAHDYEDLIDMRFEIRNQLTGSTEDFELLVGTRGSIRGIPVQITYQPNFWFQAVLSLHRSGDGFR